MQKIELVSDLPTSCDFPDKQPRVRDIDLGK